MNADFWSGEATAHFVATNFKRFDKDESGELICGWLKWEAGWNGLKELHDFAKGTVTAHCAVSVQTFDALVILLPANTESTVVRFRLAKLPPNNWDGSNPLLVSTVAFFQASEEGFRI